MTHDQNKKSVRSFQCRDYLWEIFGQMSAELECSVDYLINEAMRQYARSRNYGVRGHSQADFRAAPPSGSIPSMGGGATGPGRPPGPPGRPSIPSAPPPPPPNPTSASTTISNSPPAASTRQAGSRADHHPMSKRKQRPRQCTSHGSAAKIYGGSLAGTRCKNMTRHPSQKCHLHRKPAASGSPSPNKEPAPDDFPDLDFASLHVAQP